jgi:hypothetical protein
MLKTNFFKIYLVGANLLHDERHDKIKLLFAISRVRLNIKILGKVLSHFRLENIKRRLRIDNLKRKKTVII